MNAQALTIGRLARRAGVNLETIRYYERIGLMPGPGRTAGGHRVYEPPHAQRLAFIRRARDLGFTIADIRTLLSLSGPSDQACSDVRDLARTHLAGVQSKIADLQRLERVLGEAVSRCGAGAHDCPVIEVLVSATA